MADAIENNTESKSGVTSPTLTPEQINAMKSEIASREKDKLYKSMEDLKAELASLKNENKELRDVVAKGSLNPESLDTLTKLQNVFSAPKPEPTPQELVSQTVDSLKSFFEERLNAVKSGSEKEVSQLKDKIKKLESRELEQVREKLYREVNGEAVIELIQGNSEEEMRQSLERAKQVYSSYAEKFQADRKAVETQGKKETSVPPAAESASGANATPILNEDQITDKKIKEMSPEEFAKQRDILKSAARKQWEESRNT